MGKIIETIGSISKKEHLKALNHTVLPNTLVLESEIPYPGYHGAEPEESTPNMLFLVTDKHYDMEHVFQAGENIKKYFSVKFDSSPGKIYIYNDLYECIRIKDCNDFDRLKELQECFIDEKIGFARRKNIDAEGIIKLRKIFYLEEVKEGIYKDLEEELMHYIALPTYLRWQKFVEITRMVKNNFHEQVFDAAIGKIYQRKPLDVVRIYARDISIENLEAIQDRYIKEMKRILDF